VSGLPSHRLKQAKRALRREVLAVRDALPPQERRARSRAIAARLLDLPEARAASVVLAFWSFGSEVDTAPILEASHGVGRTVALPRVEGEDVVPIAYVLGDELRKTSFGALEPAAGSPVPPAELDLVIVPGVAFDRGGGRVGYGGGFYDRLLPRLRPGVPAIAVAFSIQVVEVVPWGGTDRRVDAIITEDEVIRCR
jgi:5-formyltetrahydrofolate cyclo-ligase